MRDPAVVYPMLLVVYEKGAIDDKEALRRGLDGGDMPLIEIAPGRRFDMYYSPPSRIIYERGAIDSEADVRTELAQRVAIVVINPGRRFEVI